MFIEHPLESRSVSHQVIHKSDIGGVKTGLKGRTDVGTAYSEVITAARRNGASQIHSVTIQPLFNFLEVHPEIKELEMNPVFAYDKGVLDVDARVVLEVEKEG